MSNFVDDHGNLHDTAGRFAQYVHPEADPAVLDAEPDRPAGPGTRWDTAHDQLTLAAAVIQDRRRTITPLRGQSRQTVAKRTLLDRILFRPGTPKAGQRCSHTEQGLTSEGHITCIQCGMTLWR